MGLFNKKIDIAKPSEEQLAEQRSRLAEIQADLDKHYKKLEEEEQQAKKQPKPQKKEEKEEDLPKIPAPSPEIPQNSIISNEELLQALKELYSIMTNRFDQIYYKIDQTQDLLINSKNNKS